MYTCLVAAVVSLTTCYEYVSNRGIKGATISQVQPTSGGIGGDVKVTISGSGFSEQFSLTDDPSIGNAVYLVNPHGTEHACTVHKEGSTPNQIMFYTPSGLTNKEDHYVKVVVDGHRIEEHASWPWRFHPEVSLTPWISSVTPQSGLSGSMVKIQSKMFTDRFNTDVATATNGRTQTLLRVYVGPHLCDLYKDSYHLYGLTLYGERSDYGMIDCKITGLSVGFFNVSYIVDPPYGRSLANPYLYHVSYNDVIYLYQVYADITHISHSKGSEAGGLILTIYGNYFDDRPPYTLPRAFIDDTPCEITEVLPDAYIKCIVAAKPDGLSSKFEGNRGVIYEYWTNTSMSYHDLDSILLLDSSDSGYHLETLDETSMYFDDANGTRGQHVGRMRFYFRPPHSGQYGFFLHASQAAKLFVDGVTKSPEGYYSQDSVLLTLDDKEKYLFEIVLYTTYSYSYINLKAKFFNTTFTKSMTEKAEQEQQRIQIRSTVMYDVQELEFDNSSQQIHVEEVQLVAIEAAGYFRFGMFGVYTEPLTISMADDVIERAILALPIWGANESVSVESTHTTKTTYNITFHSQRGNFPNIDIIPVTDSEPVSYTVTEHTPGIPDLDTVALMMDGVVSEPFSVESLIAGNISLENILEEMFTSKCPKELDGQIYGLNYYNSFEDYSWDLRDYRVRNTEAFCGRYVLKNPYMIHDNDQGSLLYPFGSLCFAYKGFYKNMIRIKYSYNVNSDSKQYSDYEFYHFFKTDSATVSKTWYYTCVNVYAIVASATPGYTSYRLHGILVYPLSGVVDAFIDSVYVGMQPTTDDPEAYLRRKSPAHYKKAFIDNISVSTLSTGKFRVTIKPLDCGYGFPLFHLANGDIRAPSFGTTEPYSTSTTNFVANLTSPTDVSTEIFTTAANSSSGTSPAASTVHDSTTAMPPSTFYSTNTTEYVTTQSLLNYTHSNIATNDVTGTPTSTGSTSFVQRWPDILLVTRISDASPPVSGLIDISFNGKERKGVNVSLTAAEFDKEMESIENIGFTEVVKTGDCANFQLFIKFLSLSGNLPQLQVNFSDLKGIEASAIIMTDNDGGLNYDPLTGDMVSTVHSVPQVRLSINDVPTACSGDCSFQWHTSVTPEISAVNPQSGTASLSTSIVISGRGFSSDISENNVTIGGVECTVTAATNTSITCNVGNGPSGPYLVLVNVDGKGRATGYVEFTYASAITSISPTSGSLGGGIKLTIAGYGFNKNAYVTINGIECDVTSSQSFEINCIVPAHNVDGVYDVQVNQGTSQLIYYGFTYDITKTATVSSVAPQILNVTGGNLTVFGSSFTNNTGSVFIGLEQAYVTFWSDSRIDIYLDKLECGLHKLKIGVTNGFAVNVTDLQLPSVIADLKITHVHPLRGSMLGGTELTITGSGFGSEASKVKVKVGTVNCSITMLTNSKVVCMLEYAGTTHYVTNKGVDPAFGVYYAFDMPFITIKEGDYIQWSWETPVFVNNVTHAIIEVDSASSVTQKPNGFRSGIPSRNGVFRHKFVRTGTFYVWSGFVDIWGIKNYAGTIDVVQNNSTLGTISVRVGNAEAEHVIGDVLDLVDDSVCKHISTGKPGCAETKASVNDVSIFSFEFWSCSTPIVNSINVNNGTIQTQITINGEGFSFSKCQNEVRFDGLRCNVTSASENSLICNIEKTGTPEVAVLHQLELRVNNRGSALINITDPRERGFALLPNIETISPVHGSIAGGTILTITGFGFGKAPLVTIGGYNCIIISSSYSEIICDTPVSLTEYEEEVNVNVFVYVHGIPLPSECETKSGECAFVYTSGLTSTVTTISPSIMSSTTPFNITGTSLGNNTSEITVAIGGVAANVIEAADTYIVASVDNIPAGHNDVIVMVKDYGKASGFLQVYGTLSVNNVYPPSGSIHGETTITVFGNGFVENDTTVTVGGASCFILSTSLSKVSCITQAHSAGTVSITVLSNGLSNTTFSYSFSTASSPIITSVIPTSGLPGDTLTLFGSNLKGSDVTVHLGSSRCDVTLAANTDKIECIVGNHSTGSVDVFVHVADLGASNSDVQFEFQLSLLSISPIHGSLAGGQLVHLMGTGINSSAVVTVCGKICLLQKATSTSYLCRTPANPAQSCDVGISLNGLERTLPTAYRYMKSLTPTISNVSPRRGGTGGGTILTISGEGFGTQLEIASVEIDGVSCLISNITNTEIRCITGPHVGSVHTKVEVQVSDNGIANEVSASDAEFQYVDVWSSLFTWGGGPLPKAGDFVVIPSGTTILLDIDTPILSFLLIQGGSIIFDEKDVELQANIIMITDGGLLQVGTEDKPFQHKGIITLHGHFRSKELPIYGTKVLAVRNGTLDLYGVPVPLTWTHLSKTAVKGSNTLHLQAPVEWKSGDEIVIASTGHRLSQHENEKKIISAVSDNGTILTLTTALEAEHISVQEMFQGHLIEMRAEVGLLTRNVVVRGNDDTQWHGEVKPCTAGFNFGLFGTNRECILGRFDDEIGSSQFGVVIFVHSPLRDTQVAQIHISYTEVTFAGQTFRLGRHPLQFYLNGNMSESFVRGCSFHTTFNRAVNIQNSQNIVVEQNVIYDILGGGFVLESGSETGITLGFNLAIRVTGCAPLLNDDLTPASYSLANPNNTVKHNAAAGGTHYGYWYKLDYHQTGTSYTQNACTKYVPLGIFQNNSAHSFGGSGLYVYNDYFPSKHGCGGSEVEVAVFNDLHSWNNNKGVAAGNIGSVQFINFTLVQNRLAGIEVNSISNVPRYTADSPSIQNSVIVGQTTVKPTKEHGCTRGGIVLPLGRGFRVRSVKFVNFNESNSAAFRWTRSLRRCPVYCGGFTYHLESMAYINTPNKAIFDWDWEGIILDRDGTSTSKSGNWTVLPTTGTLPHDCEPAPEFSIGAPASTCPQKYKWHRYAFNNYYYYRSRYYIRGRNLIIANQYGNSSVPYATKRFTHNNGWMCVLLSKTSYKFHFEDVHPANNISFYGTFYDFEEGDFLFISIHVPDFPDWFSVEGERINASSGIINHAKGKFGDWNWNGINREIKFLVNAFTQHPAEMGIVDIPIHFRIYKCFFTDCVLPPDPNKTPPAKKRPLSFQYWHDTSIWVRLNDGYITNVGKNGKGVPRDFENVKILPHTWVTVNLTAISKLGSLLLFGVLEFANSPKVVYAIEADYIIIKGGRLIIGWPDDPFDGLAIITLRANYSLPPFNLGEGPLLGRKAIGVFGGLDLTGKDKGVTWTYLDGTAHVGSRRIVLQEQVRWLVGDEIVVSPTGFGPGQSETFKIVAIGIDQVTVVLNDTLKFQHLVHTETLPSGQKVTLKAAVGLLSHNIKIIGDIGRNLDKKASGARVLVGFIVDNENTYSGYARLSNVEFYHTGHEGFPEIYDPKFSLVFLDVGNVNDIKPSSVTNCSFHNGFNTAVGAVNVGYLNVSDNVLYENRGHGLKIVSVGTRLMHNLVIGTEDVGIEAMHSLNLTLQDNLVTDSKATAFSIPSLACGDSIDRYENNMMNSNIRGAVLSSRLYTNTACARISNFIAWKNTDFGLLYEGTVNAVFERNILIENRMGVGAVIVDPHSQKQIYLNRTIIVRNTTFIGHTSSFNCGDMVWLRSNRFLSSAILGQSWHFSDGMVGLVFPTYNIVGGLTKIENVTFAKYDDSLCLKNYAITTNLASNNLQRPIYSEKVTLFDVEHANKILFLKPDIGVSRRCFAVNCDVFRLAFLNDLDGTLLGHIGTVIPKTDYDAIDYYRIPRVMVTKLDGTRIPYDEIAPNKGVVRNGNCTYQWKWQAFECMNDLSYKILTIENMDFDAKRRQISPVALLSDGYIDLIDVPLDHGYCTRYTCRKKQSLFIAIVATGKEYLLHFTRTTPRHMRYSILNADPSEGIKLTVWYSRPNRLDVFVDGEFAIATNAKIDMNERYILTMPKGNEFEPEITNETGTNYFDRNRGEITFIIKGPAEIDVVSQNTILVSFGLPALSVSEFFGENIVENLAAFLNIPLTKVRIVNIVSESINGRRKRSESGDDIIVEIEIGDEPVQALDNNMTLSDSIEYSTLTELTSLIVNECQLGNISDIFGEAVVCGTLQIAPDDSEMVSIVYNNQNPDHLYFFDEPEAEYEGVSLKTQPKIRAVDINGNNVTELGTDEYPWQITVSLRNETGHPLAALYGNLTINCSQGWFNFTDLAISHSGADYILDFNVIYPNRAEDFSLTSRPFNVTGRPLAISVYNQTTQDIFADEQFAVTLNLLDQYTDEVITNITWREHMWSSDVSMLYPSVYANLTGILNTSFDEDTGRVTFNNLSVSGVGLYYLKFSVFSDPPEYNISFNWRVAIRNEAHINMKVEESATINIKFDEAFEDVLPTEDDRNTFEQTILTDYAHSWPDVQLIEGSVYPGSIVVEFVIAGSTTDVNSTVYGICEDIYNGTNYIFNNFTLTMSPYMTLNNTPFYGVKCGDIPSDDSDEKKEDTTRSPLLVIIIASVLGFILLVVTIVVVIWRCKMKPSTKIQVCSINQHGDGHTLSVKHFLKGSEPYLDKSKDPHTQNEAAFDPEKFKRPVSGFSLKIE